MKKMTWILGIICLLIVGCTGVQGKENGTEEISLFVPMENEKKEEIVVIEELQGLKEVNEPKEVPLAKLNNAMNTRITSTFYIDEMTGVVYFVNFNKDWHIYRMKDGEVKKAVSLPADNLCMYDGSLYFMVEFYDTDGLSNIKEGDIYCYTPSTGEVKFIYSIVGKVEEADVTNSKLKVKETGIYFDYTVEEFSDGVMKNMIKQYYLPFGETEPVKDDSFGTYIQWKDYYLSSSDGYNMVFFHKDDWNNQILISDNQMSNYFVVGDEFYYIDGAKLRVRNLETGVEETIVDFSDVLYQDFSEDIKRMEQLGIDVSIGISDIVITNGGKIIWATQGSNLYYYNTKTEEVISYSSLRTAASLMHLYTDGTYVYADGTNQHTDNAYIYPFKYDLNRVYTENDIMEMDEEFRKEFEENQQYQNDLIYMVKPVTED